MKISKGLATWAGLVAALGQYLGAVALFLEADDQALALGALATATATLWKVIEGRMNQATAAIEAKTKTAQAPIYSTSSGQPAAGTTELGTPHDLEREIPGGSVPTDSEPA